MSVQSGWPITLTTPLGADVLLPEGFTAWEGVSKMFQLRLDAVAEHASNVHFDKVLGQSVTVEVKIPGGGSRTWNGIVSRIVQGDRTIDFTAYTLEVVPKLWLLTRTARSRIYQQKTVPEIIKDVLANVDFSLQVQGDFHPRNYCVQYRETDFQFVSRLMEEEGIFYFFRHSSGKHEMVIANSPASHSDMPVNARLLYDEVRGGTRSENRIHCWQKSQEIRSGKVTLWDHSF